ncbi:MAG TPA: molybdate ABC transporter substrate-binding protein [Thermoguttaceae bacterium]|nr:molybdate ABC transporter substrate-binding protein [Thermoguttaceae bacterium]
MLNRRRYGFVTFLAVSVACLGCNGTAPSQPKLLLYCGAGIRPPVAELAERFGAEHGVVVECDYAGSEVLLSRIKLNGRGDLYMPGDVQYVEQAAEQGLVESHEPVCYFIPTILVQKGNPKNIRTLDDLTRPDVTVGLGNPEACAIGRKTLKLLEKNGIKPDDLNVKFRTLTVNELGIHIELKKLDAVIVWDALGAYFAEKADRVPIPPEKNVVSTVAVGLLTSSKQPALAAEFIDYVISQEGKAMFEKHHYTTKLPE